MIRFVSKRLVTSVWEIKQEAAEEQAPEPRKCKWEDGYIEAGEMDRHGGEHVQYEVHCQIQVVGTWLFKAQCFQLSLFLEIKETNKKHGYEQTSQGIHSSPGNK